MPYLLVKHGVKDFEQWYSVVRSDKKAQKDYGIKVKWVMRGIEDPNTVVFMLKVKSVERTKEFMNRPESAENGKKAGVTGEPLVMFLDKVKI